MILAERAFPNIDTTKPDGTEYVSSIDDIEKQTRTWLRDCMLVISGYPNVNTIAVKGWSAESGRPNDNQMTNSTGKHLLYFNEDANSLEVVKKNGDVVNFAQQVALLIYPVGSIYETTLPPGTEQGQFDPNNVFGGTWEIENSGTVLVSAGNGFTLSETGGRKEVTLTENEIPAHTHPHSHPHTHGKGSMRISGWFGVSDLMADNCDDILFKKESPQTGTPFNCSYPYDGVFSGCKMTFDSSRSQSGTFAWTGETSQPIVTGGQEVSGGSYGHDRPLNIMPPYKVITRWIRTA